MLILAGTPIGSRADASARLVETLGGAELIAAEDTRRLYALLQRLGITSTAEVVSYFEGNEARRTPELVQRMLEGADVVLVTDAGMPSVSDPGFRLVTAAVSAGIEVTSVPGPSAVTTALAVSGLAVDRFTFEGFLPRRAGERSRRLQALAAEERTMVFFEAPHRLAEFLADAAQALGADRQAVVCRELTKTHEEVRRGPLAELARWAEDGVRGEITVVIAGAVVAVADPHQAVVETQGLIAAGARMKEAVAEVAERTGLARNALYQLVLEARRAGGARGTEPGAPGEAAGAGAGAPPARDESRNEG